MSTPNILELGINIDHVATLRNARGTIYPDPLKAARLAEEAGADLITLHLREDRRHIKDADLMAKATAIFQKSRRVRGTYNTFNTNVVIPENDVEQTIEQIENIVDLEPEQIEQFEIDLAMQEHEQNLMRQENRNVGGRRKTRKNKTRT